MKFTDDFIWGAASASYQIEGGWDADGKGPSIWDEFAHTPGKIAYGHTGDVACDAYHRFEEDLDLMQSLGIKAYRFSVSWPRIIPDGSGEINEAGLAYYDRLIDGCIERGIEPWVTLYHWDLPLALDKKGGWLNRETAESFGRFGEIFAKHFKGRVTNYYTFNEPQCIIGLGHKFLSHAPGRLLSDEEAFISWHHIVLAHGLAAKRMRAVDPDLAIGIASTGALTYLKDKPAVTPEGMTDAAFLSLPVEQNPGWFFNHQWFLDPVVFGKYPDDPNHPWQACKSLPFVEDDLKLVASESVNFIGLNIYNGTQVEVIDDDTVLTEDDVVSGQCRVVNHYPGYPRTALKWPVTPEILYWGPRLINERYNLPVMITENGLSCNDKIYLDGKVHDLDRIDFLHRYLRELRAAVNDGVPITGYFHWAFTDNLEWHSGFDDRFGIIYVDYRTLERIPKDSALWYRKVILTNGQEL